MYTAMVELVKDFEAALDQDAMGLSEAVAAIQTLLKFIKNCKGCAFAPTDTTHTHTHTCTL